MTPARQPQQERKKQLLYLDKSTPEEFQNAELMDWVYLVGDISTTYELDFVRQFGHALKTRATHTSPPAPAHGWIRESFVTLYSNKLFTVGEVCNLIEGHRAEAAKAAREKDIAKIQTKLDESKKNLYGFDAKEAEWINGFEAGLDAAIDILRAQQAGERDE